MLKATINKENGMSNKIAANRKEKHFVAQYTGVNSDLNAVIEARIYATANCHYACVWIHDRKHNIHLSGAGKAGGYGFHRASEALERALHDAGITLNEHIGGRGEGAMRDALSAIMKALGFRKHNILDAHA